MSRLYRQLGATLALLGICSTTLAAGPASRDLSLTRDGLLRGQVLTAEGQAVKGATVVLSKIGQPALSVKTAENGKFQFAGVAPGVYQLASAGRGGTVRVWNSELAPPKAHDGALIVSGDVARGKFFGGEGGMFSNPLCLTLIVAAAIAIPLALADDDGS